MWSFWERTLSKKDFENRSLSLTAVSFLSLCHGSVIGSPVRIQRLDPVALLDVCVCSDVWPSNPLCSVRLYAVGGRDGSSCLRSVECFDPHTNKWSMCAPMSKRRGGVGVATYNNFLYALGGHDAPASNHCSRLSDCVERWVSALSREGRMARWDGLSVQSGESSRVRVPGTGPPTPPDAPLPVPQSCLRCPAGKSSRHHRGVILRYLAPSAGHSLILERSPKWEFTHKTVISFMLKPTMPIINILTT